MRGLLDRRADGAGLIPHGRRDLQVVLALGDSARRQELLLSVRVDSAGGRDSVGRLRRLGGAFLRRLRVVLDGGDRWRLTARDEAGGLPRRADVKTLYAVLPPLSAYPLPPY